MMKLIVLFFSAFMISHVVSHKRATTETECKLQSLRSLNIATLSGVPNDLLPKLAFAYSNCLFLALGRSDLSAKCRAGQWSGCAGTPNKEQSGTYMKTLNHIDDLSWLDRMILIQSTQTKVQDEARGAQQHLEHLHDYLMTEQTRLLQKIKEHPEGGSVEEVEKLLDGVTGIASKWHSSIGWVEKALSSIETTRSNMVLTLFLFCQIIYGILWALIGTHFLHSMKYDTFGFKVVFGMYFTFVVLIVLLFDMSKMDMSLLHQRSVYVVLVSAVLSLIVPAYNGEKLWLAQLAHEDSVDNDFKTLMELCDT
mmetsp:Transcript_2403/g.2687  ORF Transcript_2403/g.2687 Transcript_2403/m.2687 type:complete len:309 (-) Transcript_2403:34-960(-)